MLRRGPSGLLLMLWLCCTTAAIAQSPHDSRQAGFRDPTEGARQLILVITDGWNDTNGTIRTFERAYADDDWLEALDERAITLGSSGLAWGTGLHGSTLGSGPAKQEGDNRSPAGVFALGMVYGYAPESEAARFSMPYLPLDSAHECIDDPSSVYYNMIVNRRNVAQVDWKSSERMRLAGKYYEWGVVVQHNADPRIPGAGSCIFLHVWGGSDAPTAGCTSLDRDGLLGIMEWLTPSAKPVLVQLPLRTYEEFRSAWKLP